MNSQFIAFGMLLLWVFLTTLIVLWEPEELESYGKK
jgi:hypothetical protein